MISIVTHGISPAELLVRRFATARRPLRLGAADIPGFAPTNAVAAGGEIHGLGDRLAAPRLLAAGVAAEVRRLEHGRRQIVQLRLPGDLLEPRAREAVVALTRVKVAQASPFLDWMGGGTASSVLRLAWLRLRDEDGERLRDHVVRLGRMTARERVAHLLLEVHDRLARIGLVTGSTFHLPLTQEMLSDVLGLSIVHVNRTLTELRRNHLVILNQGFVTLELDGLTRLAGVEAGLAQAGTTSVRHPNEPSASAERRARRGAGLSETTNDRSRNDRRAGGSLQAFLDRSDREPHRHPRAGASQTPRPDPFGPGPSQKLEPRD